MINKKIFFALIVLTTVIGITLGFVLSPRETITITEISSTKLPGIVIP